jgi:hypothetical protein
MGGAPGVSVAQPWLCCSSDTILLPPITAQTCISPIVLLDQQRWSVYQARVKMMSNPAHDADAYRCGSIHRDAFSGAWLLHPSLGL